MSFQPRAIETAVVGMYSRHPSPSRQEKLQYASNRMDLRLHCCGVDAEDYVEQRVLDAGCGTGEYSCWFAAKGSQATGIDLSKGSLSEARSFALQEGLEVRFEERSVLATDYPDESFDFVYCTGVLHHMDNPFAGLRELHRVLRTGGKILISLYNSISFTPREIRRSSARFVGRGDEDRSVRWGKRLFPLTSRRLAQGKRIDSQSALYDYFGVPYQSCHSLGEVLDWFSALDLEYCGAFPPLLLRDYPAMFREDSFRAVERVYPRRWLRHVGRFGHGKEMRREQPGLLSRALVQTLWLVTGVPMSSMCGRKVRPHANDSKRDVADSPR